MPPTPPKWSLWLCEKITALIGRVPDFASTLSANSFQPAAAVSSDNSGSTTIQPVSPRMIVITDRRSEEHTSELQSLMRISYAVFCLTKQNKNKHTYKTTNQKTN